ncbi:hypothetical protein AMATHDRAFT_57108 [Amanita thiersii Skay4041]|uniref:Uncharacterized protein n=1 Tax=Amanita thiersii Skay4041 TaxID=703135 RepID=A0A2A9NXD5_9AGAR|nr:hypothetical protein AMATHDRAFT_57108 [Amanita thiersii Skay4041]
MAQFNNPSDRDVAVLDSRLLSANRGNRDESWPFFPVEQEGQLTLAHKSLQTPLNICGAPQCHDCYMQQTRTIRLHHHGS